MRITDNHVFFWDGIYSNWHPCSFTIYGCKFNCAEQAMMYAKAMAFKDLETGRKILAEKSPKAQKALGRQVKNFVPDVWDQICQDIVSAIVYEKFRQNPALLARLMEDGKGRCFVEASPYDKIWGIGMLEEESGVDDPANWKGTNYLGKCLNAAYFKLG